MALEKVLKLHKEVGETPLECIKKFVSLNPDYKDLSLTYAGRLDPMAEGLLLVLVGEEIKEKEKYLALPKTYRFEVLWGFDTDTGDTLGLLTSSGLKFPEDELIKNNLSKYQGVFEQEYPDFSSKTVLGKALFDWAKEGRLDEIEKPKREVEIFKLDFLGSREVDAFDLKEKIIKRISKVKGSFRQEEIKQKWQEILSIKGQLRISKFEISCSSGTYVRSLVSRMGRDFKTGAVALSINRIKVGDFSI